MREFQSTPGPAQFRILLDIFENLSVVLRDFGSCTHQKDFEKLFLCTFLTSHLQSNCKMQTGYFRMKLMQHASQRIHWNANTATCCPPHHHQHLRSSLIKLQIFYPCLLSLNILLPPQNFIYFHFHSNIVNSITLVSVPPTEF